MCVHMTVSENTLKSRVGAIRAVSIALGAIIGNTGSRRNRCILYIILLHQAFLAAADPQSSSVSVVKELTKADFTNWQTIRSNGATSTDTICTSPQCSEDVHGPFANQEPDRKNLI